VPGHRKGAEIRNYSSEVTSGVRVTRSEIFARLARLSGVRSVPTGESVDGVNARALGQSARDRVT